MNENRIVAAAHSAADIAAGRSEPEAMLIPLDRKTRAARFGQQWQVQRKQPTGAWDLIAEWTGGRRSLLLWCQANDVHPTAEAEAALSLLPESTSFRERT